MDEIKINQPSPAALTETVDDILNEILGKNGEFNEEFTGLYTKYLGGGSANMDAILSKDLSDRSDEDRGRTKVEYEDPDLVIRSKPDMTKRITDRLPAGVRDMYISAEKQVQRPEFTSGGEVKYPSMGIGESEERVVFDADWEEKAKQEAAKREALRKENMLRGDSAYARNFVVGGRTMTSEDYRQTAVNPAYIDPLNDDDIRYFEPEDRSKSEKRERSLEETYGRASDDAKKSHFFRRSGKK